MTDKFVVLQAKKPKQTTVDLRCQEQSTSPESTERDIAVAQVLMESRSVSGRHALQERAVADPGEQAQCKGNRSEQTPVAGRFGPYHAGEGPVALHDALCFLVAWTNFTIRTASHCLALAASDLIPNKARFTSPALVGSLQEKAMGN